MDAGLAICALGLASLDLRQQEPAGVHGRGSQPPVVWVNQKWVANFSQ